MLGALRPRWGAAQASREQITMAHHPPRGDGPFAMSDDEDMDPVVVEQIERALAPYRHLLSPEALNAIEETLEVILTTHPVVAPCVEQLRRDGAVEQSGSREKAPGDGEGSRAHGSPARAVRANRGKRS